MTVNQATWDAVMSKEDKDTRHVQYDVANDLQTDEIETLLGVIEFFGGSYADLRQTAYDLMTARYRVFDWLGMAVMGRITCREAVKVLVYSFLKVEGDVDAFIADLRENDYQIDTSWAGVEV